MRPELLDLIRSGSDGVDQVRELLLSIGETLNLSGADLVEVDLLRANLSGFQLSRANLRRADLRRADLSGANLSEAAHLNGAIGLQLQTGGGS